MPPPHEYLGPLGPQLGSLHLYRTLAPIIRQQRQAQASAAAWDEAFAFLAKETDKCDRIERYTPPRDGRRQYTTEQRDRVAKAWALMRSIEKAIWAGQPIEPDQKSVLEALLSEIELWSGRMDYAPIGPRARGGRPRGAVDSFTRAIDEALRELLKTRPGPISPNRVFAHLQQKGLVLERKRPKDEPKIKLSDLPVICCDPTTGSRTQITWKSFEQKVSRSVRRRKSKSADK